MPEHEQILGMPLSYPALGDFQSENHRRSYRLFLRTARLEERFPPVRSVAMPSESNKPTRLRDDRPRPAKLPQQHVA